jgi:diguanylate cyclase (GGDEF)-like protein
MAIPAATPALELPAGSRPTWQFPLAVLALGLATGVASWYSLTLTRFDGGVATLCVVNGLLAGVMIVTPRRTWPWWVLACGLGQLAVRLVNDSHVLLALYLVVINLLESVAVAWWVRRDVPDLRKESALGRMALDAVFATLVASALSASLALPLLATTLDTPPFVTWVTWFSGHVLGMVLVATLTTSALQPHVGLFGRTGHLLDYTLCLTLLVLSAFEVFSQSHYPLLFVLYLPLLLLVWRHGLSGMVVGIIVLAGASGIAAITDRGPFVLMQEASTRGRLLFWNLYMAAGCLMAYTTALALTKQRQLERRLLASEAKFRQLAEENERLARHDALTGLANRRHFDEHLAEAAARAHRTGAPLVLLAFDLDKFKQINDSLGHGAGDAVLAEFARRLRDCVYDVDLVARLGGDEFVVLVEYTPDAVFAERMAERILAAMRRPFEIDGVELDVSTSIGIGLLKPVNSASALMQLADRALYEAKSRGRATWRLLSA